MLVVFNLPAKRGTTIVEIEDIEQVIAYGAYTVLKLRSGSQVQVNGTMMAVAGYVLAHKR